MSALKPRDIYQGFERVPAAAAADRTFEGPKVHEGRVVEIHTFFAVDETTAAKVITLGFRRANVIHILKCETVATGKYALWLDVPLILVEGESPYAKIASATANDVLNFVARGVYL